MAIKGLTITRWTVFSNDVWVKNSSLIYICFFSRTFLIHYMMIIFVMLCGAKWVRPNVSETRKIAKSPRALRGHNKTKTVLDFMAQWTTFKNWFTVLVPSDQQQFFQKKTRKTYKPLLVFRVKTANPLKRNFLADIYLRNFLIDFTYSCAFLRKTVLYVSCFIFGASKPWNNLRKWNN